MSCMSILTVLDEGAGDGVSMKVVSCNWGLLSLTATLLEIGDARGEGVIIAGESPDDSGSAGEGVGGIIFLNPLEVKPERKNRIST